MFKLSKLSEDRLVGVHPHLQSVVRLAIQYSEVDFRVQEGVRTVELQRKYVAAGKSQTMNSRHIPVNGKGHAIDVVALVAGKTQWELSLYYRIAAAFASAASELKIPIRWGGCWEQLSKISTPEIVQRQVEAYSADCRKRGKKAFIDAPHFELPKGPYP